MTEKIHGEESAVKISTRKMKFEIKHVVVSVFHARVGFCELSLWCGGEVAGERFTP